MSENASYSDNLLHGSKTPLDLRVDSNHGGCREFFIRVCLEIFTVPTHLIELRRGSSDTESSVCI